MAESGNSANWAAAGTGATGIGQLAYGLYLNNKNKRPKYTVPDEIYQNLSQQQQLALEGLPEAQKQEYLQRQDRLLASSLGAANSRKAGLAGLSAINQQQQDANLGLLSMDSQARQQNIKGLIDQRQTMADYRDQAFQLNKLNPYYEKVSQSQALMGAGMQNISNAGQMYGASASNSSTGKSKEDNTAYENKWREWSNENWDPEKKSYKEARQEFDSSYNTAQQFPYGGTVGGETGLEESRAGDYATEDSTWNTVGQFGAVGKVIQGVTAVGNAVGRPVRDKNEAVDPETGQLKNYKSSTTIGGAMLNPLTALQTRSKYSGGWTDVSGKGYKNYLQENAKNAWDAQEAERAEARKSANINKQGAMMAQYGQKNAGLAPQMAYGGKNKGSKVIEIEKKEVVKTPNNDVYVANAPSHEEGGKKILAPNGTIVFSDKIKVPGTKVTFAEKAKYLKGKDLDNLFSVQEAYKKSNGL